MVCGLVIGWALVVCFAITALVIRVAWSDSEREWEDVYRKVLKREGVRESQVGGLVAKIARLESELKVLESTADARAWSRKEAEDRAAKADDMLDAIQAVLAGRTTADNRTGDAT